MQLVIDLGAHALSGLRELIATGYVKKHSTIFCLEANPYIAGEVFRRNIVQRIMRDNKGLDIEYLNLAVGDKSGIVNVNCGFYGFAAKNYNITSKKSIKDALVAFYLLVLKKRNLIGQHSNTLLNPPTKVLGIDNSNYKKRFVPSISISSLISELINIEKFQDKSELDLLVKMDIEGAEYDVLESLANSDLIIPDLKTITFLIEWHPSYFEDKNLIMSRKKLIKEKLTYKYSAKILDWH